MATKPTARPLPPALGEKLPWPTISVPKALPAAKGKRPWGNMSYEDRHQLQHDTLLRITRQLAEEHGFNGTQITEIVSLAGVSRRTFYEHFGSKEACFSELLLSAGAVGVSTWSEAADRGLPDGPYATFHAVLEAWADIMGDSATFPLSRKLAASLWAEAHNPGLAEAMEAVTRAGADVFFVIARRLGSPLPDDLVRVTSRLVFNGLVGVIEPRRAGAKDASRPGKVA